MQQNFSTDFALAVVALYYPPCCHRLENRKFGTWNLALNDPTEKIAYARLFKNICQKPAGSVSLSTYLTVLKFGFHSHSSCCQQGTSQLAEVGLKLLPSLNTNIYMMCLACIILWLYLVSHNIVWSTAHICNKQYGKIFQPNKNTAIKIWKIFSVLPWHGLY